ncbi:uncharacterized protein LOC128953654 [Oppia nitens]|uniref:uncharacterized protein LOC128953654 n=1 Tax=Oppia nitens TaxID=1686743 RepID=UPI0023DBCA94|nr:uncharacterized protein LOC128953654 [Oppia nitens]
MLFIIIFVTLFQYGLMFANCPDIGDIQPCSCDKDSKNITCKLNNEEIPDLKAMFATIDSKIVDGNKNFPSFSLINVKLPKLPEKLFSGLKFDQVNLVGITFTDNTNRIDPKVFDGQQDSVKQLKLVLNDITVDEIKSAINNLQSLETLHIYDVKQLNLQENTFENLPKLTNVYLENVEIQTIKENAFKSLDALQLLSMRTCSFNKVSARAFALGQANHDTTIEFNFNKKFNVPNIDDKCFDKIERSVTILYENQLSVVSNTHPILDENIFTTLLKQSKENKIVAKIDCNNCGNMWLINEQWKSQIDGTVCTDGNTIYKSYLRLCDQTTTPSNAFNIKSNNLFVSIIFAFSLFFYLSLIH